MYFEDRRANAIAFARLANTAFPILGNLVATFILSSEDFGRYFYFYSVALFSTIFFSYGIHGAFRKFYTNKSMVVANNGANSLILFFLFLLALNFFIFAILKIIATAFISREALVSYEYFLILCCYSLALAVQALNESYLVVLNSPKRYFGLLFWPSLFGWAFSICSMYLTESWINRFLVYSIVIAISTFINYGPNFVGRFRWGYYFGAIKKMLWLSLPLVIPILLVQLMNLMDKSYLKLIFDQQEFGEISIFIQYSLGFSLLLKFVINVTERSFFVAEKPSTANYFLVFAIGSLAYAICVALILFQVLPFIYGSNFHVDFGIGLVISIMILPNYLISLVSVGLLLHNKTKTLLPSVIMYIIPLYICIEFSLSFLWYATFMILSFISVVLTYYFLFAKYDEKIAVEE